MNASLLLLLKASPATKLQLAQILARIGCESPNDIALWIGISQGDAFLDGTAHGEVLGERNRFDACVWARSEVRSHSDIADALEPICNAVSPCIDASHSAVLAGLERSIIAGEGAGLMIFAFRRNPSLTQAECHAYWHDQHGAIVRRSGSGGYRQLHVDTQASARIASRFGFGLADYDGAVIKRHSGLDTLHATLSNALVRTEALPDERVFIDHAHAGMAAFSPVISRS
jgi:hypothetical protein